MPAAEARGLAGAVAFLTRVPVGRWLTLDAADVARGSAYFPLVGAGIGRVLGGGTWIRVAVAAAIAAGFCVWLDALPLLGAAAGVALVVGVAARRWLGGVTGDVLGASAELAELAALVVAVAIA